MCVVLNIRETPYLHPTNQLFPLQHPQRAQIEGRNQNSIFVVCEQESTLRYYSEGYMLIVPALFLSCLFHFYSFISLNLSHIGFVYL